MNNYEASSTLSRHTIVDYFPGAIDLGILARKARDTCSADLALGIDSANAAIVHSGPLACFVNNMPFSSRNLYLFLAGMALFAVSLACGFGSAPLEGAAGTSSQPTVSALPIPGQTQVVVELPEPVSTSTQTSPSIPENLISPAIPESRRLTLEYPPQIRLGDTDVIRLTLEMDDLGNITPTAQVQGNLVTGSTVEIPNLYETHNVTAEARLDIAGPLVTPSELISEPLLPGQSATFYWSIRPQEAGSYRGTVWLSLRFVNKLNGEETQKVLSAQQIQIEATTFLGLKADTARAAGGVGSVVAGVLSFPFIDDVLKFLWGRLKRRK